MRSVSSSPLRGLSTLAGHWLLALSLAGAAGAAQADNPKASRFYEDALVRYEKNDIAGAIIQLKNALQIDKNMLPVQLLLGKALLAQSDVFAAEVAFNEALRLGVNRAEVVLDLARAVIDQGRPQEVLEQARFALDGLPRDVRYELVLLRAAASSDLGDHKAALRSLEEARALNVGRPEVWAAEVPIRIRSGQFAEALVAANKAVALAPGSASAQYELGSVHHAQGQVPAALQAYDRSLKLNPEHHEALIARAGLHLDLDKLDAAQRDIDNARKLAPKDPRSSYLAGLISERKGDTAAAKAAMANVTALLDPIDPAFLRYRPQLLMLGGLAHHGLGQTEKAKPYLEGVQRVQGQVAASKLLAQIYLAEGNTDRAVNTLETYLTARPANLQAVELLAQAHQSAGRSARAAQVLRNALRSGGDVPRLRTALGMALMQSGDSVGAIKELEAAWARDPKQTRAAAALSNLYAQRKDLPKATRVAELLVAREPANPGFHTLLGNAKLRGGDTVAARKAFEQSARLAPQAAEPQLALARMDVAARDYPAAARRLEAVLKANERNVEAMFELALLSERVGQRDQARLWFTKAADHSAASDLRAALALVDFHLRGGESKEALLATERLAAGATENVPVLLATVRAQLANGDTNSPKPLLTRATRLANFDVDTQIELAMLQLAAQNLPGVAYSLEKALSSEPDNLRANAMMVDVLLRQRELDKAEKLARRIATLHPKRGIGYTLQGNVAELKGAAATALGYFRQAHQVEPTSETLLRLYGAMQLSDSSGAARLAQQWLAKQPRDIQVHRELANAHARAGRFAEARKGYEAILAITPKDRSALNNLANALMRLGDPGALAAAEKALALYPTNVNIIDTTAWAAFKAGQKDRALQMLRDARLRDPQNPEVRYHLAQVLAAAGRKAEARLELEPAVRSGTPFESLADARSFLETLK